MRRRSCGLLNQAKQQQLSECSDMNSSTVTCIIELTIVASAICGSYFQLVKDPGYLIEQGSSSKQRPMDIAFFHCDRETQCTYVIQRNGSQEYSAIYGEVSSEEMEKMSTVWKKMAVNILSGRTALQKLENIAVGKPSALSSLWRNSSNASLAVDGSPAANYYHLCACSGLETNAWLKIDLLAAVVVHSVRILSMKPEYRAMGAIDVRAGNSSDDGGIGNPPCQLNVSFPSDSNILDVKCPENFTARYVTVNTHSMGYIEICELEVYGTYI